MEALGAILALLLALSLATERIVEILKKQQRAGRQQDQKSFPNDPHLMEMFDKNVGCQSRNEYEEKAGL